MRLVVCMTGRSMGEKGKRERKRGRKEKEGKRREKGGEKAEGRKNEERGRLKQGEQGERRGKKGDRWWGDGRRCLLGILIMTSVAEKMPMIAII